MIEGTTTGQTPTFGSTFPLSWKLPERVPIVEFLERHRKLSARSSSSPGSISFERFPYWREPMEALTNPVVRWITIVAASQTAKTTFLENCLFYFVVVDPAPTLVVFATESLLDEFVTERLKPAIECSPLWREHVTSGQWSVSKAMASFTTMPVFWGLASSEATLSSKPCGNVLLDETGKYPPSTANEGSPIAQAKKRQRTFPRGKCVDASTVTTEKAGVWLTYKQSDMSEWMVACPKCGQRTCWEPWKRTHVEWVPAPEGVSVLEWSARVLEDPSLAWWRCPNESCGHKVFGELDKNRMNALGRWDGRGYPKSHPGFRIPSLATPYMSFHKYAAGLMLALDERERGDSAPLKDWTIHEDAWPWEAPKVVLAESVVTDAVLREMPRGRLPIGTCCLTCGVDVQHSGFFFVIWAWTNIGGTLRNHVVDHGFVRDYDSLDAVVDRPLEFEDGKHYRIEMTCIDSSDGVTMHEVYHWCSKRRRRRRPVKGASSKGGGWFLRASAENNKREDGGMLVNVWPDEGKDFMAGQMKLGHQTYHAEAGADEEFQKHMTSQEKRWEPGKTGRGGRETWCKRDGREGDHFWDAANYGVMAAVLKGLIRNDRRWRKGRKSRRGAKVAAPEVESSDESMATTEPISESAAAAAVATTTREVSKAKPRKPARTSLFRRQGGPVAGF